MHPSLETAQNRSFGQAGLHQVPNKELMYCILQEFLGGMIKVEGRGWLMIGKVGSVEQI